MEFNLRSHLESRLKDILVEAPEDDKKPTAPDSEDDSEDMFSQADIDNSSDTDDSSNTDDGSDTTDPTADTPSQETSDNEDTPTDDKEKPEYSAGPGMSDAGSDGSTAPMSDLQKVNQLFNDTGNPEIDYGLTSESNVRMAKFKFKNAGIDPLGMMDESEHTRGIRVDELEARLTPDQYELYREKWKEVRRGFKKISEREQRVVIYNSNIPFFYNDESGTTKQITHKSDTNTAINNLNKYMVRNFTEDWVDNKKAIKFLQGIRINFSEDPKIRPNLISARFFEEYEDRDVVPFNKLHADVPESVRKFLTDNIEMDEFKKSSVFRTLSNDYVGENSGSSRTSVYTVIKGESATSGSTDDSGTDALGDSGDTGEEETDALSDTPSDETTDEEAPEESDIGL